MSSNVVDSIVMKVLTCSRVYRGILRGFFLANHLASTENLTRTTQNNLTQIYSVLRWVYSGTFLMHGSRFGRISFLTSPIIRYSWCSRTRTEVRWKLAPYVVVITMIRHRFDARSTSSTTACQRLLIAQWRIPLDAITWLIYLVRSAAGRAQR